MNTTRKFPRTLNEAFPHGANYACSIEHSRGHITSRVHRLIVWLVISYTLLGVVYWLVNNYA